MRPWTRVLSLTEEARDYVSKTPSERAELVDVLCRDAALMLESHPDAARALDYQDPLPESSKVLMARLRAEYRSRRGQ